MLTSESLAAPPWLALTVTGRPSRHGAAAQAPVPGRGRPSGWRRGLGGDHGPPAVASGILNKSRPGAQCQVSRRPPGPGRRDRAITDDMTVIMPVITDEMM